jgi:hypothetical protein
VAGDVSRQRAGTGAGAGPDVATAGVRAEDDRVVCGVGCAAGRNGEMLLCGFRKGHFGAHAWASLPTFIDGGILADEQLSLLIRSLGLAHDVFATLIDPDPARGLLTALHNQGVSDTYREAVRVVEILSAALEAVGASSTAGDSPSPRPGPGHLAPPSSKAAVDLSKGGRP